MGVDNDDECQVVSLLVGSDLQQSDAHALGPSVIFV